MVQVNIYLQVVILVMPNVDFGLLGANGLLIDENGDIILCQHGDRRLAKINNSSTNSPSFTTLVDNYEEEGSIVRMI